MNPLQLVGKHAIITGASGGIGSAIARLFAHHGARLTLVGRNEAKLSAALSSLPPPGISPAGHELPVSGSPGYDGKLAGNSPAHRYVVADVAVEGSFRDIVKQASQESKPDPALDILVNAAGISHSSLLLTTPDSTLRQILDTNLLGTMLACKYATRDLIRSAKAGRDPSIINIASLLASHGGRGSSAYAASKAGVVAFTRTLAAELGPSCVRVNAILPGYIDTEMTSSTPDKSAMEAKIPIRRFGHVDDVAHAALFLVQNRYAHNCNLNIDGGLSVGLT